MLVQISKDLESAVQNTLNKYVPSLVRMDVEIINTDAPSFKIVPKQVKHFSITQEFSDSFMDTIQIGVELTPQEYIDLIQYSQNLRCAVNIWKVDNHAFKMIEKFPPTQIFMKAIVADMQDLLKKYNINELLPKDKSSVNDAYQSLKIPVTLQLLTDTAYDLRHKQFHTMLKDVKIIDAIYYIANIYKIKAIKMIPPDNERVYKVLPIPPMHTFGSALDFLHQRYGVYSKGMEYYYTHDDILYIYPGYDTRPKLTNSEMVLNIYNIPAGHYAGNDGYHYIDGTNIHIVSNGDKELKCMVDEGIETVGNFAVSLRSDTVLDVNRQVDNKAIKITGQMTTSVGIDSKRGMSANVQNAKYTTSTDNLFMQASKLAEFYCSMAVVPWSISEPFTITPGQKVILHYDDQGKYNTHLGIVESVRTGLKTEGRPHEHIYSFTSILVLRLEPEPEPET